MTFKGEIRTNRKYLLPILACRGQELVAGILDLLVFRTKKYFPNSFMGFPIYFLQLISPNFVYSILLLDQKWGKFLVCLEQELVAGILDLVRVFQTKKYFSFECTWFYTSYGMSNNFVASKVSRWSF